MDTCGGGISLIRGGTGLLSVSDCIGQDAGDYILTMNVVSETPDNCARPLPCGGIVAARLDAPGEVDSFQIQLDGREPNYIFQVVPDFVDPDAEPLGLSVRVFDPDGALNGSDCGSPFSVGVTRPGTYTVLVSACDGVQTGSYRILAPRAGCHAQPPPGPPQGPFAYITNFGSGTVSVVDIPTTAVIADIRLVDSPLSAAGGPAEIAITPNGAFAYATYPGIATLFVIDTAARQVRATIPVGTEARGVAFTPNGASAYVLANGFGGVWVIDTATQKTSRFIPLPFADRSGVAVSPDGSVVYVTNPDPASGTRSTVSVIDAHRNEVVATITGVGGNPRRLAFTPDGTAAYVTTASGVSVITTAARSVTKTIPVSGDPFAVAFTPDGAFAYVTLSSGQVSLVNTITQSEATTFAVTGIPADLAISPDGATLYVVSQHANPWDENGIFVIDRASKQTVGQLFSTGASPFDVAITTPPAGLCVGDSEGETKVTIDELVLMVNYALEDCPNQSRVRSSIRSVR
jgi:YVTN family beta-propeller protein